jgi:hypothetical protein
MRSTYKWTAVMVVVVIGVTACGDDDGAAAQPSTASFCAEAQERDNGDDSGPFTEFYARHPDPTPEDWAADGHLVTDAIQAAIDQVGSLHPSEEAQPYVDDVLATFEVMKQNSIGVSQAGADGDQSAIDDLERVNQDTNVPAMMTAFQAVEGLCESAAGS